MSAMCLWVYWSYGLLVKESYVHSLLKEEHKLLPMNYNNKATPPLFFFFLLKIPPTLTAGPGEINLELTGEISSVLSAGMCYVDCCWGTLWEQIINDLNMLQRWSIRQDVPILCNG